MTDAKQFQVQHAPPVIDWVPGDLLGLEIPAHADALAAGGAAFLTRAFRGAGTIDSNNSVVAITRFEELAGGSTGKKLMLSVEFERPMPKPGTELFVKFSRDFSDEIRDRGKDQLESEVKFALLSRDPDFPIAVPHFCFADYHQQSGTGILITERVAFGSDGIEPHYDKCLDHRVPNQLEHYKAIMKALARLAGAHRAGRLPKKADQIFRFDVEKAMANDRITYTAQQLRNRVARYAEFSRTYPQLFAPNITSERFIRKLSEEVSLFRVHELAIKRFLCSNRDMIALCHWNANIDNAWFSRDASGQLECGLMDWGRVDQMSVAVALGGALMGADTTIWDLHLDELLTIFVREYVRCGGPEIGVDELRLHLDLTVATTGLAWLMDAPPLIRVNVPDLAQAEGPLDSRFEANETARTQLQMFTVFLNLWETHDVGKTLKRIISRG